MKRGDQKREKRIKSKLAPLRSSISSSSSTSFFLKNPIRLLFFFGRGLAVHVRVCIMREPAIGRGTHASKLAVCCALGSRVDEHRSSSSSRAWRFFFFFSRFVRRWRQRNDDEAHRTQSRAPRINRDTSQVTMVTLASLLRRLCCVDI